jgi:hypothetical protein
MVRGKSRADGPADDSQGPGELDPVRVGPGCGGRGAGQGVLRVVADRGQPRAGCPVAARRLPGGRPSRGPSAPGANLHIPSAWGHAAGPPPLRITATMIKVTEGTSQIRTAATCRPRPWYSAFPRRRRELRRYGGWRSGDRTLSCAGISSLDASRLKVASSEASLGSVWPSTLWMEFRAWRSQPARLITGTCVAGSLDR